MEHLQEIMLVKSLYKDGTCSLYNYIAHIIITLNQTLPINWQDMKFLEETLQLVCVHQIKP